MSFDRVETTLAKLLEAYERARPSRFPGAPDQDAIFRCLTSTARKWLSGTAAPDTLTVQRFEKDFLEALSAGRLKTPWPDAGALSTEPWGTRTYWLSKRSG